MADAEQGTNNIQTEDAVLDNGNDIQLKSTTAATEEETAAIEEETPSVHISNSKEVIKSSDGEETTQDSSQEDEDNVGARDKKEGDTQDSEDVEGEGGDEEETGEEIDEEDEEGSEEEDETGEGEEEEGEDDDEDGEEGSSDDEDDEEDDEDDDIDGEDGDDNTEETEEKEGQTSTAVVTDTKDDSDIDKCPVCLCPFTDQDVGTPESCDHTFCLECIMEWSKMVNTCPVDRSIFRAILVRHTVGGDVVKHVDVDEPKTAYDGGQEDEDPTYCEVCGRCDREDRLLLCDGCDAGYHCECLTPPLQNIPVEEWFCPECVARNRHHDTTEVVAGDESEDEWTTIENRPTVVRAIARTRVSEHVRAVITHARAQRLIEEEATRPSTSARRKTKTGKKKTTKKRKRKTTKSPKGKKGTGKKRRKRKTVRRKKGGKKRLSGGARTVKRTPSTTRGRIAKSLQLVKPRSGSVMPDKKVPVGVKNRGSMDYRLSEIGTAKLSITGNNALFEPSDDEMYGQPAAPVIAKSESVASTSGVTDLLGSIMAGQSKLLTKSRNITIHRDGNLTVNKDDEFKTSSKKKTTTSPSKDETQDTGDKLADGDNSISCSQNSSNPNMHNEDVEEETKQEVEEESGNQSPMDQDGGEESDEADEDENRDGLPHNPDQDKAENEIIKDNLNRLGSLVDEKYESQEEQDPVEDPNNEKNINSIVTNSNEENVAELPEEGDTNNDDNFDEITESVTRNNTLTTSESPSKGDPETSPEKASQDPSKDASGDLSQDQDGGDDDPKGETDENVCNENKTDTVAPPDSLGKEDSELNMSMSNVDDNTDGADRNKDGGDDDKEEGEGDKSDGEADEGTRDAAADASTNGISDKVEDIEVIQIVSGAERTVTRKSIPAGSKNSMEAGEIEILRVDIINKPKRKGKKGDRKRHGSSSSFDSQSEEEGAIPERRLGKVKAKSKKKSKESKRHSKDGEGKGKKMGDSTAEEGEVKSDDEGHGKKKKKRKRKKKNKDTRNVIVDPDNPKLLPELSTKAQKSKMDGKKSDSDGGKSRDRGGNYGDLRQVIQVKRGDPQPDEEAVRRYEAYWNEFGKRRGDERRVEANSSQWEQLYSYGAFTFGEGKQWENFTVQRDRSPIYDRRKEKESMASKRMDSRRSSRGDRSAGQSRDRQFRPEKETMAERAVRLEREAAKRERQQQELARRGGRERLTMAEIEARQLMRSRMDEHIERKYGKQGFLKEITRKGGDHDKERQSARDKHGREHSYEQEHHGEKSMEKNKERRDSKHTKERGRKRQREASRSSRSHDDYSSDRLRSEDKRSYDSDMSRSSSRSCSLPSDKEPEPPKKSLPKTSTVPKPPTNLSGQKTAELTKKKKKDKTKGKKDKKSKEAKKAAKKAKGAKAGKKDKGGVAATQEAAGAAAKRLPEAQANEQPPAKKQKKIKGKKDKKKKKAAKLAKAGKVPAPRPTCLIQDDEDPDVIDLTGEIEDRSPTPSTPPTPKPATPTKPPPKDPSPIVSSTADIRGDGNHSSSILYDPFEPTVSPPVSYSNSPSPVTPDGVMQARKGPSSSSVSRVSRSGDRDRENSSKRPYSPRDAPHSRRSPQDSPPHATSSSTANSIAKLLPALSSQTNSQINQLLGSISSNPALQSVLGSGGPRGTSLSGSHRSPSGSEQSYSKVTGLGLESPVLEERTRPTKDSDNRGDVSEEDIESSAVDLYNKNSRERYLKKLHHQERVVEEVKLAIKPHYQRREINKDEYKEILRKSVNQVCHSKSGEINPVKIRNLIEGYVKKAQTKRKLGTTMKPLIITSDKSRSSSKRVVLNKLIL